MFNFIASTIINSVASIHSVLFAPLGSYVVTTTTLDPDGETWTDTTTRMTQEQLNRWLVRIRPDLANDYTCEAITLEPGASLGLGSGDYETLYFVQRVSD